MATSTQSILKKTYETVSQLQPIFAGGTIEFSSSADHIFCTCGTKVHVVSLTTGNIISSFDEDDDIISCFSISPDDKWLITAGQSLLLRQWNWQEESCARVWKSVHIGPIATMAFDPTSTLLATGSSDSTIKIWDIGRNYYTHNLKGSQGVVSTIIFHPDPTALQLFSAADDYKIRQWDLKSSKCIAVLESHYSSISRFAFSPDSKTLLSGGRDNVVNIWNLCSKTLTRTIPTYEIVESLIAISPEIDFPGKEKGDLSLYFVTVGSKGIIRFWRVKDGHCLQTLTPSNSKNPELMSFTHLRSLEHTKSLAAVTFDHNIMIYDFKTLQLKKLLIGHNDEIIDAKFVTSDDTHIAVATNSPDLRIFERKTMSCHMVFGHTDTILSLDVSYDRRYIATSSKDNTVRIWKGKNGSFRCVAVASGHTAAVPAVAFSKKSNAFIVSGSNDSTLKIWPLPRKFAKDNIMTLSANVTMVAHKKDINSIDVAPNDKLIATGSQDKTAKLWLVSNGSLLGSCIGHRRGIWTVQFSPVDQCIVTCSGDTTIKIWSVSDFTCVKTFEGHSTSVIKVVFVSQGMQLLSSDSDGLIKLWTIKTNECENTFDHHADRTWALSLSSTEEFFVSGGADSNLVIWMDTTLIEREKKVSEAEEKIVKEQKLSNLLHEKKYLEALKLAITLDKPYLALNVIKSILAQPNAVENVESVIQGLRDDQVAATLRYLSTWNTNAKHSRAAQIVLSVILKNKLPEELIRFPGIQSTVEGLLPYTERHYQRLDRLLEQSYFIEYTLQCMKASTSAYVSNGEVAEDTVAQDNEEMLNDTEEENKSTDGTIAYGNMIPFDTGQAKADVNGVIAPETEEHNTERRIENEQATETVKKKRKSYNGKTAKDKKKSTKRKSNSLKA